MAANYRETGIKTIRVKKDRLLAALQQNLETHKANYREAVVGYESAQDLALAHLAEQSAKGRGNLNQIEKAWEKLRKLVEPRSYEDSYKQAIALMEWEERVEIELSLNDFECYVRDNWDWKATFNHAYFSNTSSAH